MAGRSRLISTVLRSTRTNSNLSASTRIPISSQNLNSPSSSSVRFNGFSLRNSQLPSNSRLVRRELGSIQPFHSAIASACLVSKLPSDVTASSEGRFANYLSPI